MYVFSQLSLIVCTIRHRLSLVQLASVISHFQIYNKLINNKLHECILIAKVTCELVKPLHICQLQVKNRLLQTLQAQPVPILNTILYYSRCQAALFIQAQAWIQYLCRSSLLAQISQSINTFVPLMVRTHKLQEKQIRKSQKSKGCVPLTYNNS